MSSMRSTKRCPRVSTTSDPSDAATAPATTRRPLPSIPRSGSRRSLLDSSGRLTENSVDTIDGSRPGPSSAMTYSRVDPRQTLDRLTSLAPASKALSTSLLQNESG
jgi:hypothetical protein